MYKLPVWLILLTVLAIETQQYVFLLYTHPDVMKLKDVFRNLC